VIEPRDDHPHPPGAEPAWSESTYFNFHDPSSGLAGFSRIGFRPNEGTADATLFLFLPGSGAVAVLEKQDRRDLPEEARVGGIAHLRGDELKRWRVTCLEKGLGVAYAGAIGISKHAPSVGAVVSVKADLDFAAVMPPFGTSGRTRRSADAEASAAAVAAGHFEQACRVRGSVTVGDAAFDVDGLGLRDRSWGPRDWSAPWGWRWFSIPFSSEFAIGVHSVIFPGREVQAGWVWRDGRTIKMTRFSLDTTYEGEIHRALAIEATDAEGETYAIRGEVGTVIPLTIGTTRIHEGLTRFRIGEIEATGIAEYLDNTGSP
jgi:hypothetical protein